MSLGCNLPLLPFSLDSTNPLVYSLESNRRRGFSLLPMRMEPGRMRLQLPLPILCYQLVRTGLPLVRLSPLLERKALVLMRLILRQREETEYFLLQYRVESPLTRRLARLKQCTIHRVSLYGIREFAQCRWSNNATMRITDIGLELPSLV